MDRLSKILLIFVMLWLLTTMMIITKSCEREQPTYECYTDTINVRGYDHEFIRFSGKTFTDIEHSPECWCLNECKE